VVLKEKSGRFTFHSRAAKATGHGVVGKDRTTKVLDGLM
jgi:hypothetical protein